MTDNVKLGIGIGATLALVGSIAYIITKKNKCAFCLEYPEIKIWDVNYEDKLAKVYFRVNGREIKKTIKFSDPLSEVVDGDYTLISESNPSKGGTYLEIRNNKDKEIEDSVFIDYKNKRYS